MNVYQAIQKVMEEIGKQGISKDNKNQQQGYHFRGIDDVLNALSPILVDAGLCILPCVLERQLDERQTKSGGNMFYVTVKVRFDFVCAKDGSRHEIVTYGEAMDAGDKATNKAMSAAYKYAAIQAFCIPTEGDNDADATTPEASYAVEPGESDVVYLAQFNAATTVSDLTKIMNSIPAAERKIYTKAFNARMSELKKV